MGKTLVYRGYLYVKGWFVLLAFIVGLLMGMTSVALYITDGGKYERIGDRVADDTGGQQANASDGAGVQTTELP